MLTLTFTNLLERNIDKIDKDLHLLEKFKAKHMKLKADTLFIKSCKKENIVPTFAKMNSWNYGIIRQASPAETT